MNYNFNGDNAVNNYNNMQNKNGSLNIVKNGTTKAGLILCIVGASILMFICFVLFIVYSASPTLIDSSQVPPDIDPSVTATFVSIVVAVLDFFLIVEIAFDITIVVLAALQLEGKRNKPICIAVFGIIFGGILGIIGGILLLVGTFSNNSNGNSRNNMNNNPNDNNGPYGNGMNNNPYGNGMNSGPYGNAVSNAPYGNGMNNDPYNNANQNNNGGMNSNFNDNNDIDKWK